MPRISIIGAGGYVFPLTLIRDICAFPALQESTISLMDIDASRLRRNAAGARKLVRLFGLPTRIESTTDRRRSLEGADFVVITFQVGGLDAYACDVEIPRDYGIDQTVGDTLGPGGVFRGLRSIEVLRGLAADAHEVCPNALVMNYANPMAINTWAAYELGLNVVGLCHSVQGTAAMLARQLGVPVEECRYRAAGVNHQAWYIQFEHAGQDMLPRIREVMSKRRAEGREVDPGQVYEGIQEGVRADLLELCGCFHTESSHHGSEYAPWFRKDVQTVRDYLPSRWDYLEVCRNHDEGNYVAGFLAQTKAAGLKTGHEYGAYIVDSVVTGTPRAIHGSVRNNGLITNLPPGCAVEVPCLVNGNGVQPTHVGELPPVCAAVNRACVSVQHLAVRGGLTGDRELVHAAIAMDPLTGALLTLPRIREMVDRLFDAEAQWLPSFARP